MNRNLFLIILFLFLGSSFLVDAQNAPWVSYPSANITQYGVYHFRKVVEFNEVPQKLVIHVSADNRYNLFVNGERVCYGPAKGDLKTYNYDVIDIAKYLKSGKNILASIVYNGGEDRPLSMISSQTAFMLRSEDERYKIVNTNSSWKVYENPAYKIISYNEMIYKNRWYNGFYACGGGDEVNAKKYPWGWAESDFNDSHWLTAESLYFDKDAPWNLVPRVIAYMDNHIEQPARIRKVTGTTIPVGNWDGTSKLKIPAHTKATILLDFDLLTMGYPELTVNGGEESKIQIKYAEALYEGFNLKAHRDSVNGKIMYGVWDVFKPNGEENRTFRPLWKRTFRYVQFVIETGVDPLEIISFENEYSGYPYLEMATFESNNQRLNEIFEISNRTLRMCSGETYYDTPFYEQLSYGGDNLPIAVISTYNSTDDRLLREMMRLYSQSVNPETGLLKSAYPSRFDFDMGSWSLAWIQSLYDYYLMRSDAEYVRQFIPNMNRILGFYKRHLDEKTGLIGTVNNQNFIDWSNSEGNLPRKNKNKEMIQSVMLTLYYTHTLDCAEKLYSHLELYESAENYAMISKGIKKAINENCWDENEQLFRDYADHEIFSQHTNIMAILCDLLPYKQQEELLLRILNYDKFDEMASSYFSFFLFKAMQKVGREDLFMDKLDFWYTFIDRGHTTCGETGFASHDRSDCHAWSAHPSYFLLNSVCGIKPADIGFNSVKITPNIGELTSVKASMPHPKGRIEIHYEIERRKIIANIQLAKGLEGIWEYKGKEVELKEGSNRIIQKF